MIGKERIVFVPADAADTDNIGAYVRAGSDGDLIASQTINAEEWLNVASVLHDDSGAVINGSNPLPVEITSGVNVEVDLSHVDDSVALGDGTNLLTSTTVGADIGLDVNVINASLVVSATDLDIRDLTQADEVTVFQGTDPWIIGDGGGSITVDGTVSISGDVNVTQGTSPWVVSATDLDIRDLTAASDSVAAWLSDGSGNAITSSAGALDVNFASQDADIDVNITNASVVVSATDLDIRDLTHVSDSVRLGDGTNFIDSYNNDLAVADLANTAIKTTAKATSTTQSALLASSLANRRLLIVQNVDNSKPVYLAEAGAADAAATGLRLSAGAVAEFRFGAAVALDVEAASGTPQLRILEAS